MTKPKKAINNAFPIRFAVVGEKVRVVSFSGGKKFQGRIFGMGLSVGAEIDILRNRLAGPVLIGREESRFFLGGGMAHKINVMPINGGKQGG